MMVIRRALVAVAVLAPIAGTAWVTLADASSFEIECGRGPSGVPTPLVVQLLDHGAPAHGSMLLRRRAQDASGEIDVEVNVVAHRPMCGAVTPGQFHLRGTSAFLNGKTMTVTTRSPVRIEVQDSMQNVLLSRVVDPAAPAKLTISW